MRRFIPEYRNFHFDYLTESDSHMAGLKAAIEEIDKGPTYVEDNDKLELIIKIDNVDLADRIHKYILQNEREYGIKSVSVMGANNLKVKLKTKEEIKKDEKEEEDKAKAAEDDMGSLTTLDTTGNEATGAANPNSITQNNQTKGVNTF